MNAMSNFPSEDVAQGSTLSFAVPISPQDGTPCCCHTAENCWRNNLPTTRPHTLPVRLEIKTEKGKEKCLDTN